MRTVVHLSDLHFGRSDPALVAQVQTTVESLRPDIIIISGDLTQRASQGEFKEARAFVSHLEQSGLKVIVVPGNHDIAPHHHIVARLIDPLRSYREHFSETIEPFYQDGEIAVIGIDTTSRTSFAEGKLREQHIARVAQRLQTVPDTLFKIAVTHHPIALPLAHKLLPKYKKNHLLARGSRRAVLALAQSGVDLLLAGHNHRTTIARTGERHDKPHREAIAVQAGTLSTRIYGQEPSFNKITLEDDRMRVDVYEWNREEARFEVARTHGFVLKGDSWLES